MRKKEIYFHLLGCILFLSLPVIFSPEFSLDFHFVREPFFQREFSCYALLIIFFYLSYFVLIPKFFFQRSYAWFIFFILLSYFVISFLPQSLISAPHHRWYNEGFHGHEERFEFLELHEYGKHLSQFLMVFIFSLMLRILGRWRQTEKEKLNAELSYLKAQINPHFLFNTLNSIYSLAIQGSEYTATAVVKLSEMMRYVTTEANKDFVSMEKEIGYISSYIELQKVRFGDTVKFSFHFSGDISKHKIAPLILIPFVENAFKHGVNPEEDSEISISIVIENGILRMEVFNKKVNVRLQEELRTEQGIDNTKKRLEHLYANEHTLKIENGEHTFLVVLIIHLNELT